MQTLAHNFPSFSFFHPSVKALPFAKVTVVKAGDMFSSSEVLVVCTEKAASVHSALVALDRGAMFPLSPAGRLLFGRYGCGLSTAALCAVPTEPQRPLGP